MAAARMGMETVGESVMVDDFLRAVLVRRHGDERGIPARMARAAPGSPSTAGDWFKGFRAITAQKFARIAADFGATAEELLAEADALRAKAPAGGSARQGGINGAATPLRDADDATHLGAVWRPRRLYRAVTWGSWIDPLNPRITDPPARPYPEVTLVDDDDIERVGPRGFTLIVNCDLLSNWTTPAAGRVGPRWLLWINPDQREAVSGAAIGYRHPTLGNVALLLVEDGTEWYVSTDAAGEVQQRWPYEPERLLGLVVLAVPPPRMMLRVPVPPDGKP